MKKLALIACIIFAGNIARSQLIDNKVNFYLGYSVGNFQGNKMTGEGLYNYPALFSNYQDVSGYSFRALVNVGKHLSYGVGVERMDACNWVMTGYTEFSDSRMNLSLFSPEIRIHSGFVAQGLFNRLRLFGGLAPGIGVLSLSLSEEPFEILGTNASHYTFLESEEFFAGFSISVGADYALAQWMGLFIEYSQHFNWASSPVFQEGSFFISQLQFGLIIRILKDKRYYYY